MTFNKNLLCALLASLSLFAYADGEQPMQLENDSSASSMVTPMNETTDANNETLVAAPVAPVKPQAAEPEKDFANAWGFAVGASTLGISFNLAHALYDDYLDLRGQYNYFPISSVSIGGDGTTPMDVKFNTMGLLLDYKPFGGVFRITGGAYLDGRKFSITGSGIDIGDNQYGSGEAGISFPAVSPYLGIGVGSYAATTETKKGFLIAFDAGVMFSKANAYANLTCDDGNAGGCASFDAQKQSYLDDLNSGLASFPYYPVVSLSLGYRF